MAILFVVLGALSFTSMASVDTASASGGTFSIAPLAVKANDTIPLVPITLADGSPSEIPAINMTTWKACDSMFSGDPLDLILSLGIGQIIDWLVCMIFLLCHWIAFLCFSFFTLIFSISVGLVDLSDAVLDSVFNGGFTTMKTLAGTSSNWLEQLQYFFGSMQSLLLASSVTLVWEQCMTVVNLLVGVVLLVIAFAEILHVNLSTYAFKKMFPTLILAVVAANFSMFFCRILLDLVSVFADIVMGGTGEMLGAISSIFPDFQPGGLGGILSMTINLLYALLLSVEMLILALIYFFRRFYLMFLAALAPIYFLAMALPQTKQHFSKWMDNYIKWAFAPVFSLSILWLGAKIINLFPVVNVPSVLCGAFQGPCLIIQLLAALPKIIAAGAVLWWAIKSPFSLGAIGMAQAGKIVDKYAINPMMNNVKNRATEGAFKAMANAPEAGKGGLLGSVLRAGKSGVQYYNTATRNNQNREKRIKGWQNDINLSNRIKVEQKDDGKGPDRNSAGFLKPKLKDMKEDAPDVTKGQVKTARGPEFVNEPEKQSPDIAPREKPGSAPDPEAKQRQVKIDAARTEADRLRDIRDTKDYSDEYDSDYQKANRDYQAQMSTVNFLEASVPPESGTVDNTAAPSGTNEPLDMSDFNIDDIVPEDASKAKSKPESNIELGEDGATPQKNEEDENVPEGEGAGNGGPNTGDGKIPIRDAQFEIKGASNFNIPATAKAFFEAGRSQQVADNLEEAVEQIGDNIEDAGNGENTAEGATPEVGPDGTTTAGAPVGTAIPAGATGQDVPGGPGQPPVPTTPHVPEEGPPPDPDRENKKAKEYDYIDGYEDRITGNIFKFLKGHKKNIDEEVKKNADKGGFLSNRLDGVQNWAEKQINTNNKNSFDETVEIDAKLKHQEELQADIENQALKDYYSKNPDKARDISNSMEQLELLRKIQKDNKDALDTNNKILSLQNKDLGDLLEASNRLAAKKNLADQQLLALEKERNEFYRKSEQGKKLALAAEMEKKRIDKADAYTALADSKAAKEASSKTVKVLDELGDMVERNTSTDLSNEKIRLQHELLAVDAAREQGKQKREAQQWETKRGRTILKEIEDQKIIQKGYASTIEALQSNAQRKSNEDAERGFTPPEELPPLPEGASEKEIEDRKTAEAQRKLLKELSVATLKSAEADQKIKVANQDIINLIKERTNYRVNHDRDYDDLDKNNKGKRGYIALKDEDDPALDAIQKGKIKEQNATVAAENARLGYYNIAKDDAEREKKEAHNAKRAKELEDAYKRSMYIRGDDNDGKGVLGKETQSFTDDTLWDAADLARMQAARLKAYGQGDSLRAANNRRDNPLYKPELAAALAQEQILEKTLDVVKDRNQAHANDLAEKNKRVAEEGAKADREIEERYRIRADKEKAFSNLAVEEAKKIGKEKEQQALKESKQAEIRIENEKAFGLVQENNAKLAATRASKNVLQQTQLSKMRAQAADAKTRIENTEAETLARENNAEISADLLRQEKRAENANNALKSIKSAEDLAFFKNTGAFDKDKDRKLRADYITGVTTSNALELSIKKETGIAKGEIEGDIGMVAGIHNTLTRKADLDELFNDDKFKALNEADKKAAIEKITDESQRLTDILNSYDGDVDQIEKFMAYINNANEKVEGWAMLEKKMVDEIDLRLQNKKPGADSHFEKMLSLTKDPTTGEKIVDRKKPKNAARLEFSGVKGYTAFMPKDMNAKDMKDTIKRSTERMNGGQNLQIDEDSKDNMARGKIKQDLKELDGWLDNPKYAPILKNFVAPEKETDRVTTSTEPGLDLKKVTEYITDSKKSALVVTKDYEPYKLDAMNLLIKFIRKLGLEGRVLKEYQEAREKNKNMSEYSTPDEIFDRWIKPLETDDTADVRTAQKTAESIILGLFPGGTIKPTDNLARN